MKTVTIAIQVPVDEIDLSGSEVTVERSGVMNKLSLNASLSLKQNGMASRSILMPHQC
jgi:hypothetical protein